MSIEFVCPSCSGTLRVSDDSAGQVIRCGACMTVLRVPGTGAEPAPPVASVDPPGGLGAPPSLFEPDPGAGAPADAVPVARPRARVRGDDREERDRGEKRPRRRRPAPPPPRGRGVLFWLGLVGGLLALITCGCCGGLYLAVPVADWKPHESAKGGFRVDLPAPARKDMDKLAGGAPDPNVTTEGTILFRPLQEYAVVYRELPFGNGGPGGEKPIIDAAVEGMKTSGEMGTVLSQRDIVVDGFPGRELELSARDGGYYGARIIVAETRLYILIAGGKWVARGEPNVRRFLDSFAVTDPRLKASGERRQAAAKQAEEVERVRKEQQERDRLAREKADADQLREREQRDVRNASRAIALEGLDAADGEQREVFRAIEVAARLMRDIRGAGELSTETALDLGEAAQLAVVEAREALRFGAEAATAAAVQAVDLEHRTAAFQSGIGRYTARPPVLPAEPVFRLAFDGTAEQRATAAPGGNRFELPAGATFAGGPSGTALYLPPETRANLIDLPPVGGLTRESALTVSAWIKTTATDIEVFRFGYEGNGRTTPLAVRVTGTLTHVQVENVSGWHAPEKFAKLTAPSLADGRWHHVAITRQEVGHFRREEHTAFYVDGKRVGRYSISGGWDREAKFCPLALAVRPEKRKGEAPTTDTVPDFAADEVCVFAGALNELAIRKLAGLEPLPEAPAPRPAVPLKIEPAGVKLPYNTAMVFDTGRGEMWLVGSAGTEVFGAKPTTPYLYRYSLSDLKETGRYELPAVGSHAAFDPKTQRLYLAAKLQAGPVISGALYLFDLSKLEKNDGTAPPRLRPVSSNMDARSYYALALAPDGKHLYAVRHEQRVNERGKLVLYRFAADLKGGPKEVDLPGALSTALFAMDPGGGLIVVTGPATSGLRFEIDIDDWRVIRTDRWLWGSNWVCTPGGRVFVGSAAAGVTAVDSGNLLGGGRTGQYASAFALSPDGRYMYFAEPGRLSQPVPLISVFQADADWAPPDPLPNLAAYPVEKAEGMGPMTVSDDGRWIVFRNGGVVKVTGAPEVRSAPRLPVVPRAGK